jgi:Glycine-zipper domain
MVTFGLTLRHRLQKRRRASSRMRLAWILSAAIAASAAAQEPIVYPAKGQSANVQSRDQGECRAWAQKSTGIDPAVLASQPVAQDTGPATGGGERARGAARGAVGGAAIGAIAGDAGDGAAVGAVVGTMAGGRRARQNQAARNDQAVSDRQQMMNTYYRAYGACMEGRGYTIR